MITLTIIAVVVLLLLLLSLFFGVQTAAAVVVVVVGLSVVFFRSCDDGRESYTYSNGDHYRGEMRAGKPHGQGTVYINARWRRTSVQRYEGEFRDGEPHGCGLYIVEKGGTEFGRDPICFNSRSEGRFFRTGKKAE